MVTVHELAPLQDRHPRTYGVPVLKEETCAKSDCSVATSTRWSRRHRRSIRSPVGRGLARTRARRSKGSRRNTCPGYVGASDGLGSFLPVEGIAILIPVLGRPERAKPLVESIRSSASVTHRVLFLCSPSDGEGIHAYGSIGDMVIVEWNPGPGDFARKTNRGLAETSEPFVFCGATDLTFQPGWDTAALAVAEETGAGVIGTWDGANPAVKAGRHSTHSLVRRSYAENPGCTADGTGTIYCELYDHQCVDNELCELAQTRGQWAFAAES